MSAVGLSTYRRSMSVYAFEKRETETAPVTSPPHAAMLLF